jgi:hypothetical protein
VRGSDVSANCAALCNLKKTPHPNPLPASGARESCAALIQSTPDCFTSAVRERMEPSRKDWVGESVGVLRYVLLCLLCLILYAPGLASIPSVDRDEARFAQATRQMLETGDFIRIRFQEEARNKKPIGIHWLQAAAVALFSMPGSTAIWPYRLPSALAATIAVLFTSVLGATLLSSRRAGFVAGPTMASALVLVVEAHLAKTDATLSPPLSPVSLPSASCISACVPATRCLGGSWSCSGSPRPQVSC